MSKTQSIRGHGLGGPASFEADLDSPAPRFTEVYECSRGHRQHLTFAEGAEPPIEWACFCGANSTTLDRVAIEPGKYRDKKSHYDHVLERRTIPELEQLLQEKLDTLRPPASKAVTAKSTRQTA